MGNSTTSLVIKERQKMPEVSLAEKAVHFVENFDFLNGKDDAEKIKAEIRTYLSMHPATMMHLSNEIISIYEKRMASICDQYEDSME